MNVKTNLQVIIFAIALLKCESAALLRRPKIYNALITTDQNLTPSRAYPVIQPSIHDPFAFYGPYGYSPYNYYNPFGFNPFESAAFVPKYNADGTINVNAAKEGVSRSQSVGKEEPTVVNGINTVAGGRGAVAEGSAEKAPIPLNEFGFPPSLIQLTPSRIPANLAPFPYSSYPLIYDQFTGYPQATYLPHFGVLPQTPYGTFGETRTRENDGGARNDNGVSGGLPDGVNGGFPGGVNGGVQGAPGAEGLAGQVPPFGGNDGAPGPVNFDRENGVSHGTFSGNNPSGINGDNGIGGVKVGDGSRAFDAIGNDDLNNGGFRIAAINNFESVISDRAADRGSVANDARLRGNASSAFLQGSNTSSASGDGGSDGVGAVEERRGTTDKKGGQGHFNQGSFQSTSGSQGQSSLSLSSGSKNGFVTGVQSNSKV